MSAKLERTYMSITYSDTVQYFMKGSVCLQAESYKERILEPREEAKKTKKEEEFRKFLGPAWKGKGTTLGGVSHK